MNNEIVNETDKITSTPKSAPKKQTMVELIALTNINSAKYYNIGETFKVNKEEAEYLINVGAATIVSE